MEKSWVWLPRNSLEYVEGATSFASASAKLLGDPIEIFCPCVECRNLCHQPIQVVVDHLVIEGMEQKYKRNGGWSIHGEAKSTDKKADGGLTGGLEAFELLRTAFYDADEGHSDFANQNVDDTDDAESKEEYDFRKKLKEVETPLYSRCNDYTKVSAIMGLYRIKVKSGMSENYLLSQAVGTKISWPAVKVITDTDTWSQNQKKNTAYSSASDASLRKIFITDWNFGETVVAEGRLCSSDPKELFNNIHIGPNAAIVKIDKVIDKKAPLWRPSETMLGMADALHENITWSFQHVHEMKTLSMDESADKRISPPRSISNSTCSTNKSLKKKCLLLDCDNFGETVAEGKLFSSNLEDKVHNAPLGPNASKVWVEVIKVGDARVWRRTPEFETIADTLGTIIAWPNNKLKLV